MTCLADNPVETSHLPYEYIKREGCLSVLDTPFWVGDQVRVSEDIWGRLEKKPAQNQFEVSVVDADVLQFVSPYLKRTIAYGIASWKGGETIQVGEDDMSLVERGNLWRFYHDEAMSFTDVAFEARFFYELGMYQLVLKPETQSEHWSLDEALLEIQKGKAHWCAFESKYSASVRLIRFTDEDLGRRIAAYTLSIHQMST